MAKTEIGMEEFPGPRRKFTNALKATQHPLATSLVAEEIEPTDF
jgi:hypothetical protein